MKIGLNQFHIFEVVPSLPPSLSVSHRLHPTDAKIRLSVAETWKRYRCFGAAQPVYGVLSQASLYLMRTFAGLMILSFLQF